MQDISVEKLFEEQIEHYSKTDPSSVKSPLLDLFTNWVRKERITKKLAIAEFGGAAGQLLAVVSRKYPNATFTNIEIVKNYQKKQVSPKIQFVNASILKNNFKNNSFDVLIIRDVLHHLIGKNLRDTRLNQALALKELKRLLRPNGIILIEELINQSPATGRLIYYLSRLNSKIKIRIKRFEISPETIICLFDESAFKNYLFKIFNKKNIISLRFSENTNWKGRIVHLGAKYGKLSCLINLKEKN